MEIFIVDEKKQLHPNAKQIEYYINDKGCHICISHRINEKGYPIKHFNGSTTVMSRYIWYLNTGVILESEIFVLHKCDNPNCINIKHLFIGSNNDNVQDKVNKDRQAKHSGLTEKDIYNIKRNTENTSIELSKTYNVSSTTIMRIWNEKIYKYIHVDNYENIKTQRKDRILTKSMKNLPHFKEYNYG